MMSNKFFVGFTREHKGDLVSALMTARHHARLGHYKLGDEIRWQRAIRDGIRVFVFTETPRDFHVGWTRPRDVFMDAGLARFWSLDENIFIPGTNGPKLGEHEAELFKTTDVDVENAFAYCGKNWGDVEGGLEGFIKSLRPHRYVPLAEPEPIGFYSDGGTQEEAFIANGTIIGYSKGKGVNWPFYRVDGEDEVLRADDLPYCGIGGTGPYLPLGQMVPVDQRKSLVRI